MKILVTALSDATSPDGVSRHAINLTRCLLQRTEVERIDLVAGGWQASFLLAMLGGANPRLCLHEADVTRSSMARNRWYSTRLPLLARSLKSNLVHATYPVPVHRSLFHCPVAVTLHDLYPLDVPQNFGYPRVLFNRLILHQCLHAVDAIACVSRSTLARLERYSPSLMTKASCIYNCVEPVVGVTTAPLPQLNQQPFILAVAQHRRNKNLSLTLRVFERLLTHHPKLLLCLIGREGPETNALRLQISRSSLQQHVVMLHGISDEQLQWCYRHAKLLLATSTVEGFGLPIAEAMLAGCPIACSDIAAHRELAGGYAHFAPLDAAALDEAALHALWHPRPQPSSFPQFSTFALAEEYLQLYRELLSPHSSVLLSSRDGIRQKGRAA
jgi:glycosyltransferase involved in cell wall biosynthesis